MLIELRRTFMYVMTRPKGSNMATIRRYRADAGKVSPPLPLEMIKALGLLTCPKGQFDKIAKTLCTISKKDLQEKERDEEEIPAPVVLKSKLTEAEKRKQKSNLSKPNNDGQ